MKSALKQLAAVVACGVVGVGSSALAGYTGQSAFCTAYSDGSGFCYGSFLGFRNHPNSLVFASFTDSESGYREFSARYAPDSTSAAQFYGCMPGDAVKPLWSAAIQHRGYFYISWGANGLCNRLHLANGSQYSNF